MPRMHTMLRALLPAAALLLVAGSGPVLAKESLTARLDAPIAIGTPPGTEIMVGVTVTAPSADGSSTEPVYGSPIYLRLTGRHGATTDAMGEPAGPSGHYVMRITVPAGGVRGVEVGMRGTSDLPIRLQEDPLTFRAIGPTTAQVAPAPTPALTPFARAAAAPASQIAAQAAPPPVTPAPEPALPAVVVLVAAAIVVAGVLVVYAVRRRRIDAVSRARGA